VLPSPPSGPCAPRPLSRLRLFLLAVAATLAQGARAEPVQVVVLPVVVHSLEREDYLRAGLADMIASRLGQSPQLSVLRVEDPERATTELEQARAAARELGADYVLFGSFTHFGEGASLDLACAPVAGDAGASRQIFVQSGALGEIIPRLDDLAGKVTEYLTSGAGPEAAPGSPAGTAPGAGSAEVEELRARIEALERHVYGEGAEPTEAADADRPAALPAPGPDEGLR
jgi:hypothetical protein